MIALRAAYLLQNQLNHSFAPVTYGLMSVRSRLFHLQIRQWSVISGGGISNENG